MADNGRLNFTVTLDNDDLKRKAEEIRGEFSSMSRTATSEGSAMEGALKRVGAAIGSYFAIGSLKSFAQQIVSVRGEFQQLELAFKTMLGSGDKAAKLMDQLVHTAATTPFGVQDITQAAKQLLAYGVASDEVNDTLIRLGDIAAGLSIPIGDLSYLYGTTMVQGRLFTQDLRQFTGRGIPLTQELAKQFGVAEEAVGDLVTKGKVGFEQVRQAIVSLTSEGGKFGGLMAAQSQTLTGKISAIQDSIEQMFNTIGQQSEGALNDAIDLVGTLVDHWQEIVDVLLSVVKIYGAYKAATIAVNAALIVHRRIIQEAAVQTALAKSQNIALSASQAKAAATTAVLSGAFRKLSAAFKANPIGLVVAAIMAAVEGFRRLRESTNGAAAALKKAKEEQEAFDKAVGEGAAASIAKYKQLQDEYKKLKSAHEKTEWIAANKSAFDDLGVSVKNITDAERVFVKNTEAMVSAFKQRALAAAQQAKMEELAAKIVEREQAGERTFQAGNVVKSGDRQGKVERGEAYVDEEKLKQAREGLAMMNQESYQLNKSKIDETMLADTYRYTEEGAKKALEAFKKFDPQLVALRKQLDILADDLTGTKKKYDDLMGGDGAKQATSTGGDDDAKKATKERMEREKAAQEALKRQTGSERDVLAAKQAALDLRQAELDGDNEGFAKRLKQNQLNYDRLILENEKRQQEMVEKMRKQKVDDFEAANPKKEKTGAIEQATKLTAADLPSDAMAQIEAYNRLAGEEMTRANKQALDNMLADYRTYEEQRQAIQAEFAAKRSALTTSDGKPIEGVSQEHLDNLDKGEESALSEVDHLFAEKSEEFQAWAASLASAELSEMEMMLAELSVALAAAERTGGGGQGIAVLRAKVDDLKKRIKQAKNEADAITPKAKAKKQWEDLSDSLKDVGKSAEEVGEIIGEAFGSKTITAIGKMVSTTISSTISAINGITTLVEMAAAATTTTATTASSAIKAVETASVILAIISAALQAAQAIANVIKSAIDAEAEKEAERVREMIESIDKQVAALDKRAEKAFGNTAANLRKQQMDLLVAKRMQLEYNIAKEQGSKNPDNDKINEWTEQWEEVNDQIEGYSEDAEEAIFGNDIQSAIEGFGDALTDAWEDGKTGAEGAKEYIRQQMRDMVSEAIKDVIQTSAKMEQFREILKAMLEDGILDEEERRRMEALAEQYGEELDQQFEWAKGLFDGANERESNKKGIATASQESVDELNGRMTAVQIHVASLDQNTAVINRTVQAISQSVFNIEQFARSIPQIKSAIDDIKTQGLRLRP